MKLAAVLLALVLVAACSAATLRQPEVPRIRCIPMGAVPDGSAWWVYVCTFTGDSLPPLPLPGGPIAGVL